MPRFFVRQNQIEDGMIKIVGDDAHHIARSLRMAVGDSLTVCDMQGNQYECEVSEFDEDRTVSVRILATSHADTESPCKIRLFQALSKGDKLDTVIQKSVECGVYSITPFESERCVVRMKDGAEDRKTERRRRIASEAAKQCGRGILPEIGDTLSFSQMIESACESDIVLFCYEGDGTLPLGRVINDKLSPNNDGSYPSVSVIIGSEGGFSLSEVEVAKEKGMLLVGLGKRILRTETAPIFVLSALSYAVELQ